MIELDRIVTEGRQALTEDGFHQLVDAVSAAMEWERDPLSSHAWHALTAALRPLTRVVNPADI